jgi:3-deoxy-7-phosphoheptulonate synthase
VIVTVRAGHAPDDVKRALAGLGLWAVRLRESTALSGEPQIQFAIEPYSRRVPARDILAIEGVASVLEPDSAHPELDAQPHTVAVGPHAIGKDAPFAFISGPCSLDTEERIRALASRLAKAGARFLRGGAFKPRTSPYAFQGRGPEALEWMRKAARDFGMAVVTECMSEYEVDVVAEYADLVQVGSRNMQNYALLKHVARAGRPVLLKRGMAATLDEWLLAGEYLRVHGCPGVVFCERGVRGFDPHTRNLLDLGTVALLAHVHGFPVVVDPSHGTGRRDLVPPLCRAARALGAHGVMAETHDDPGGALSDGPQALDPEHMEQLARELTTTGGGRD